MKGETVGQHRNALRNAARGTFEDKQFVVNRAEIARELLADGRGADQSARQVSLDGNLSANRIVLNAKVIGLFTCKV